jgi:hypothetical protein
LGVLALCNLILLGFQELQKLGLSCQTCYIMWFVLYFIDMNVRHRPIINIWGWSFKSLSGNNHVKNWMVTKTEAHRVLLSYYFINKMALLCIVPLILLCMHKFFQYFLLILSVIRFFSCLFLWTLHNWALPTSQGFEWSFNTFFFKLHIFKHQEFVKIHLILNPQSKMKSLFILIHGQTSPTYFFLLRYSRNTTTIPNSCPQTLIEWICIFLIPIFNKMEF